MRRLPPQTQTLCSELLDRLISAAGERSPAKAAGAFVSKQVKGRTYVYFQYSEPGGKVRQLYLGPRGPHTAALIEQARSARPGLDRERADLGLLCAQVLAGGAWSMGGPAARVLKAFADAGVFETGTVLVGTHAYGVLGNMLGARWQDSYLRTFDLDLAAVSLAAAGERMAVDAPAELARLELGFLPVPGLDPRSPSTSFKVRGQALRVDFLTPGKGSRPVPLPALGTCGQPLPYLDFLIEGPLRAAVPDAGGFLVLVPSPARYALHKLLVAEERPASEHAKALKDRAQAGELCTFLADERPADLKLAIEALKKGGGWKKARASARKLPQPLPFLDR